MTRKDYERIAQVIRESRPNVDLLPGRNYQADVIAESMADMLASDNPRFDRARFLEACNHD